MNSSSMVRFPKSVTSSYFTGSLVGTSSVKMSVFPFAVFVGDDAVAVGERFGDASEEFQAVEKVTHFLLLLKILKANISSTDYTDSHRFLFWF